MFLWRLHWSKYDSQGLRAPSTCSHSHRLWAIVRSISHGGPQGQRVRTPWTDVERTIWNPSRMNAFWKAKQMNWTRVWSMFYKTWPLWTAHFILIWPREGHFYLQTIFKLLQIISVWTKWPWKTYDVSFTLYYQGFYDSAIYDNMTDSVIDFLESGMMNGSGWFSNWCSVFDWLKSDWMKELPSGHQIENL